MKRINYSRVFTQKLRQNNVFGTFCEYANEKLLSYIYAKKDMWTEVVNMEGVQDMITGTIMEVERNDRKEEAKAMLEALKTTNEVWEITEGY